MTYIRERFLIFTDFYSLPIILLITLPALALSDLVIFHSFKKHYFDRIWGLHDLLWYFNRKWEINVMHFSLSRSPINIVLPYWNYRS